MATGLYELCMSLGCPAGRPRAQNGAGALAPEVMEVLELQRRQRGWEGSGARVG